MIYFDQQHADDPEEQSHTGSLFLRIPLIIPVAHPTPDRTVRASSGQFNAHAPHSMQLSRFLTTTLFSPIEKTSLGQTSRHIEHLLHFKGSSFRVTTFLR